MPCLKLRLLFAALLILFLGVAPPAEAAAAAEVDCGDLSAKDPRPGNEPGYGGKLGV